MSVGHAEENVLRIRDQRIAAHHIRIIRQEGQYLLEVTADEAVTTLNGIPLRTGEQRQLEDGDVIGLADLEFLFTDNYRRKVRGRLCVTAGVHSGKVFRIGGSEASIGRAMDNDVQFPDKSVSRHHCRIRRNGEAWWIEDLGSTNGTLLHGVPLQAPGKLQHGDEVVAGFSTFVFQEEDQPLLNLKREPVPPCN